MTNSVDDRNRASDTPMTDAAERESVWAVYKLARQLERELAEAEWKAHHREQMVETIRADFRELQGQLIVAQRSATEPNLPNTLRAASQILRGAGKPILADDVLLALHVIQDMNLASATTERKPT